MNCSCCMSPARRRLLAALTALAGTFAAARSASAVGLQNAAPGALSSRVQSIDIHAHYYPENYCDLVGGEGKAFGGAFTFMAATKVRVFSAQWEIVTL